MPARTHSFDAAAFVDNFSARDLQALFPQGRTSPHEMRQAKGDGELFAYPFGAVVFRDVPREERARELERLAAARPGLTAEVVRETFRVVEEPGARIRIAEGDLTLDALTPERAGIVALTVAQSAAMEYYERLVEQLFDRTRTLVARMESRGTVALRTRPLHRFIAEAIGTRSEVLSILHLLDKPDAVWDDAGMDRIYADLRGEFDLADRYGALELKLRAVQEALELVLDVARDRRLVLLEVTVVLLILFEIVLSLARFVG
ncbi:MAG TPA: RMD1 family protein [Thermoanaerobaculia bacterium]